MYTKGASAMSARDRWVLDLTIRFLWGMTPAKEEKERWKEKLHSSPNAERSRTHSMYYVISALQCTNKRKPATTKQTM